MIDKIDGKTAPLGGPLVRKRNMGRKSVADTAPTAAVVAANLALEDVTRDTQGNDSDIVLSNLYLIGNRGACIRDTLCGDSADAYRFRCGV